MYKRNRESACKENDKKRMIHSSEARKERTLNLKILHIFIDNPTNAAVRKREKAFV